MIAHCNVKGLLYCTLKDASIPVECFGRFSCKCSFLLQNLLLHSFLSLTSTSTHLERTWRAWSDCCLTKGWRDECPGTWKLKILECGFWLGTAKVKDQKSGIIRAWKWPGGHLETRYHLHGGHLPLSAFHLQSQHIPVNFNIYQGEPLLTGISRMLPAMLLQLSYQCLFG